METLYVYLVECLIGRSSWLDKYIIICHNADDILPMILATGVDSKNAYGEPKEQCISIHSVQKFGLCKGHHKQTSITHIHRYYCDVTPIKGVF